MHRKKCTRLPARKASTTNQSEADLFKYNSVLSVEWGDGPSPHIVHRYDTLPNLSCALLLMIDHLLSFLLFTYRLLSEKWTLKK